MTKEEIQSQVQEIFRRVFADDSLIITPATSQDDIEDWDSLEHINILSVIEQKFGVKFDLGEVMSMKTVGDIIKLITSRVAE